MKRKLHKTATINGRNVKIARFINISSVKLTVVVDCEFGDMEINSYLRVEDDRRRDKNFFQSFFVVFVPNGGETVGLKVQTVGFGVFSVGFKEFFSWRTVKSLWRIVEYPRHFVKNRWGTGFSLWLFGTSQSASELLGHELTFLTSLKKC